MGWQTSLRPCMQLGDGQTPCSGCRAITAASDLVRVVTTRTAASSHNDYRPLQYVCASWLVRSTSLILICMSYVSVRPRLAVSFCLSTLHDAREQSSTAWREGNTVAGRHQGRSVSCRRLATHSAARHDERCRDARSGRL